MSEEKRNRIAVAITVNAILLIFIIVVIILSQVIQIGVLSKRRDKLNAEYVELEQKLNESEGILDRLQTDEEYYDTIIKMAQMGLTPWNVNS